MKNVIEIYMPFFQALYKEEDENVFLGCGAEEHVKQKKNETFK